MVDCNTDFFKEVDNFKSLKDVEVVVIRNSSLDEIPDFTIAIPTYKRPILLKEAIDSSLNQIGNIVYDIIVVDNNPERGDETEILMSSFTSSKIGYYKNSQNVGMINNWNRLFLLAKGRWLIMLHDDDLLLPNYLDRLAQVIFQDIDAKLFIPEYALMKNGNYVVEDFPSLIENSKIIQRRLNLVDLIKGTISPPSGVTYDTTCVINCGGFNESYYPTSDYCFFVLFLKKHKISMILEKLFIYRIEANESLKSRTLNGFLSNDYYLSIFLMRKLFKIPSFIINLYQTCKIKKQLEIYRSINSKVSLPASIPVNTGCYLWKNIVFSILNLLIRLYSYISTRKL